MALFRARGATPAAAQTYPLSVATGGRYLETADGDPHLVVADTPWLVTSQLTQAQAQTLIDDRVAKGFNALQLSVLGTQNTSTVTNIYGKAPFSGAEGTWDLSSPLVTGAVTTDDTSPDYDHWDHVEWVVDACATAGLLAVLVPCWYGFAGRDWRGYVTASNATDYGTFLASRLGDRDNVMWLLGGDNNPVGDTSQVPGGLSTADVVTATNNMAAAILSGSSVTPLMTYHCKRTNSARTWFDAESWYTVGAAYADENTHTYTIAEWNADTRPVHMIEAYYDDRTTSPILDDQRLRAQSAWSVLSGATGFAYGHEDVWDLSPNLGGAPSGWETALDAASATDTGVLGTKLAALHPLVPDHRSGNATKMLTSGYGTAGTLSYAVSAVSSDGTRGACYFPNTRGSIVVNLAAFTGTVTLTWWNPDTQATEAVGTFAASGTQAVTYPSGWADALLTAEQA